jgi:hypothetical protein
MLQKEEDLQLLPQPLDLEEALKDTNHQEPTLLVKLVPASVAAAAEVSPKCRSACGVHDDPDAQDAIVGVLCFVKVP